MISFPNAKINIGLNVTGKRNDGFHNIETVFLPVPLTDILEIIESETLNYSSSGITVNTENNNLCLKAYQILKKDFPELSAVHIHLHKAIPVGAGLGGGSSDAAYLLRMMNEKFNLEINDEKLEAYSLACGSDAPFFIKNKIRYATGRGELFENINLDLTGYKILLVNPGIHVDTKTAFGKLSSFSEPGTLKSTINLPVTEWKDRLVNDFEKIIFPVYPGIAAIKQKLYERGAVYASMSGTGSTVFGIFKDVIPETHFPLNYFCKSV